MAKLEVPVRQAASPSAFLGALGLYGLGRLEPILLAALATEAPVLLVGEHGTAKSLLIERISGALGLPFRHYNASLLNYDDLVGIPLPDESGSGLRFVGTHGAIWGAGFVLFDEISRCRPEMQNKLFPLIHERRVAGIGLPDLRHRWAAMNPPASTNGADDASFAYLGSEALDAALADRFAFIVRVPGWAELTLGDRFAIVEGGGEDSVSELDLAGLVARCAALSREIEVSERARISAYVVRAVGLLAEGSVALSPRRARTLARCVASVHAARVVLEQRAELSESALLALSCALPQTADANPPASASLTAVHIQAWAVAELALDDPMREVLTETDSARRIALALRLGFDDNRLSSVVTQAIASERSEARKLGLGAAAFLAFRRRRNLTPAAWSVLGALAQRVLAPSVCAGVHEPEKSDVERWRSIKTLREGDAKLDERAALEDSFLIACFRSARRSGISRRALARFRADLELLGVREHPPAKKLAKARNPTRVRV